MATIRARTRADGSIGYSAIVRVFKKKELIHQEQETFSRRAAAEKWAKARELALEDPTALLRAQAGDGIALKDLIQWYMDTFRSVSNWGRTKQSQLEALKNHTTGQADALQLDSSALVDHVRARRASGVAPSTAGNDLTWLGVVLRAAKSVKKLPVRPEIVAEARNACRELRLIGKSRKRVRTPTYEELVALDGYFERTDRRSNTEIPMRQVMWFAIYSTRRQEEITRILRSDNDPDRRLGLVRDLKHPTDKQGNHRHFRYTPEAWAIMEMQSKIDGEDRIFPCNPRSIGSRFTRACKMLGIKNLHFHDLRHEGTTRLFESGLQIPEVAAHTLHDSWAVLKGYTHIVVRSAIFDAPFLPATLSDSRRTAATRGTSPASRRSVSRGRRRLPAKATSALQA